MVTLPTPYFSHSSPTVKTPTQTFPRTTHYAPHNLNTVYQYNDVHSTTPKSPVTLSGGTQHVVWKCLRPQMSGLLAAGFNGVTEHRMVSGEWWVVSVTRRWETGAERGICRGHKYSTWFRIGRKQDRPKMRNIWHPSFWRFWLWQRKWPILPVSDSMWQHDNLTVLTDTVTMILLPKADTVCRLLKFTCVWYTTSVSEHY